ncbi:MAG: (d)CMP kinase, partial [Chloroflexi bacterium]
AVTVEARHRGIAATDVVKLVQMLRDIHIVVDTSPNLETERPLLSVDGRNISRDAHEPAIAAELSRISGIPEVRRLLIEPQQRAAPGDAVVLGRDIGTVIFPDVDVKFFFTAPAAERVARRRRELDKARGSATPDAVLEQEVEARDRADQEREVAPLRPAKSVRQVFDEVMARLPKH